MLKRIFLLILLLLVIYTYENRAAAQPARGAPAVRAAARTRGRTAQRYLFVDANRCVGTRVHRGQRVHCYQHSIHGEAVHTVAQCYRIQGSYCGCCDRGSDVRCAKAVRRGPEEGASARGVQLR